jgi:hypothetical protein
MKKKKKRNNSHPRSGARPLLVEGTLSTKTEEMIAW